MVRPKGEMDNGWVREKLEVSDKLYEKIKSSNLFKFWMNGEEKRTKVKVYRKYYEYFTKDLFIMLEFREENDLIQRAIIASHNKNLINNVKAYLN